RWFRPEEGRPGGEPVVVLGYGVWQRRFGGDPRVVGMRIELDDEPRTVVGVMPPDFRSPAPGAELWVPLVVDTGDRIALWSTGVRLVGRLRPGATLEAARAELRRLVPGMRELFPWKMPATYGSQADVVPLLEATVGEVRPLLLVLLAAVGVVLLVACANVANLLLVRSAGRRRELALRSALGATRAVLARHLLAESLAIALAGGAAGVLLALGALGVLRGHLPADLPRAAEIGVDARVLAFALALSLATGLGFGLVPALRASAASPFGALREDGRGGGAARHRLARALVVAEVALATMLVSAAGLLIKSFRRLLEVDPGFRVERVVSAAVAPPLSRYPDDVARRRFYAALLERARALPGVDAAAVAGAVPLGKGAYGSVFSIEGRPDPATETGEWPFAFPRVTAHPEYFRALGIPVVAGRAFTAADAEDAPPVVLVSRALAARYWPGGGAIGARIRFPGKDEPWRTIVGIVGDVKWDGLGAAWAPALYVPLSQGGTSTARVVLRTAAAPAAVAASLRAIVAQLDPATPVSDVRAEREIVADAVARPRGAALLLGVFAALALGLGVVGVYGVLAYAVGRRTREIGVRMALGAEAGRVRRMVLAEGGRLAGAGVALGLGGSLAGRRALASLLYGVRPSDPATLLASALLLALAALLAAALPALRATRVAPAVALRAE
ncbi:MAG: ABC transporter permease, partial [Gemmatimonadetes bacterium]|nr:ABC transporter permease [Gemmatimonadota bacterium]